ncbi:hypothetical protein GGF42_005504 [Coemansia sp. RSA 2424]|nr:hypothetical protein GGF42_005504 [Coemansia sp. RSA 2424]
MLENHPPGSLDSYSPETTAHITAFTQRVKWMAPNIHQIGICKSSFAELLLVQRNVHIVDLIQRFYDTVETKTVFVYGCSLFIEYMDLKPICNLVRIDYRINVASNRIMTFLRRSTNILQPLDLTAVTHTDFTELIHDPDSGGRWLECLCVHTLQLYSRYETCMSQNSVSNGTVPFPRLLRLDICDTYPFGDDALFRGNAATLEYLSSNMDTEMAVILRRHNVFTPTGHLKLQYVNVNMLLGEILHTFTSAAKYLQFVLSISPRTLALAIPGRSRFGGKLTHELQMLGNHANI